MNMFPQYLKVLALNFGISSFVVLMISFARESAIRLGDFLLPAAIQFLVVTVIFVMLDLLHVCSSKGLIELNKPDAGKAVLKETPRSFYSSNPHSSTQHSLNLDSSNLGALKQNSAKG
jgi:hypothetical protein